MSWTVELLKHAFFRDSQPKLSEGIFCVAWALEHAIQLNTGGINGPMQVGVVGKDKTGNFMEARLLADEELAEHQQNVEAVTEHLAAFRRQLSGAAPVASPPSPPAAPADRPASA